MSNHKHTHGKLLVDRGGNGGSTGEYVTFINAPPYQHVNILGIANNYITSVPTSSIATLDHSQVGPLIIIMHQYAYHRKGTTIHSSVKL